ncbi:possible Vinculin family [Prochlorococcus marinus str. MIT 9313]|uniref:Possible Vinculin family n=1 Tax=Prochlorococcus marinus (strain MIT 9313) TaxID=74547 RepID=Q7V701_PROMM|nr:possible Vinculin family [Prochlorococcus marinus str. MIT 9313]
MQGFMYGDERWLHRAWALFSCFRWLGMTMGLFSKRRDLQVEFKPPKEVGTNFKPQRDLSPISRDDEFKRRLEQTLAESPSQRED